MPRQSEIVSFRGLRGRRRRRNAEEKGALQRSLQELENKRNKRKTSRGSCVTIIFFHLEGLNVGLIVFFLLWPRQQQNTADWLNKKM